MATEGTRRYAVDICDQCIALEGEMCLNPACVFCWRSMVHVREYLNVLLICPIVDGERFVLSSLDDEIIGDTGRDDSLWK